MIRGIFVFLFCLGCLYGEDVVIDLNDPTFQDGVLTTEEGGILRTEEIRIQAKKITYMGKEASYVEAEGDLMLEYGCDIFTGERLEYDFTKKEGVLYCGRSAVGPWYIGGERIIFCSDGSYIAENAYLTTCEDRNPEWKVKAECITAKRNGWVCAKNVTFRLFNVPLFWIPRFQANVRQTMDIPLTYELEWGGLMGSKAGIRYRFLQWQDFKAYLRLEYFFSHGPGAGIETEYCPSGRSTRFFTQSYVARDRSVDNPINRTRYRFAGRFDDCWKGWAVRMRYDKLSDLEMASDYRPNDFNLHTARWTELQLNRQACWWIANIETRVRINSFQTINQELPFATFKLKPLNALGFLSFNRASFGYLNYVFARETPASGFNASRIALHHAIYRPIHLGCLTLMPGADLTAILYSNSPQRNAQVLATVQGSIEAKTQLSRIYGCTKHTVEPYISYGYTANPTSRIPEHFIFSINDGYTLLNITRFGIRNNLFVKSGGCFSHPLYLDLFAYAFFDTPTIKGTIPRLYADLCYSPTSCLTTYLQTAWNASHHRIDHFNAHLKWTINEDVAFNILYRYRSPFAWRKADWSNFVLDSFRPESQLLASPLSDRRYTIITRIFMRLAPTFAVELETRHGWRRRNQPAYNEGKLSFHWLLGCRWYLTVFLERWEFKKKVVNFGLNLSLGKSSCPCPLGRENLDW